MQQKPHQLERNKSSFLCPRASCEAFAGVAALGHWPSKEVLLAEIAGTAVLRWEGREGPEMPSGAWASVPAPLAPSHSARLPCLRKRPSDTWPAGPRGAPGRREGASG